MISLRKAGQLETVAPGYYISPRLPRFAETFLDFVDNDEGVQAQRNRTLAEMSLVHIHLGKLGQLADGLEKRGLARPAKGPGWELWVDVEPRTADLYMAYLQVRWVHMRRWRWDPLTDRSESIAAIFGTDATTGLTLKRARELRVGVLNDLLPAPSAAVSVDDLVEFKRDHGHELSAFRDRVDGALIDVAAIEDADAREERTRILRSQLVQEREELAAAMTARRWPAIAFGAVAGVVTAAAAVTAPFFLGGGLAAAAFAAPGLVPSAYSIGEIVRQRPNIANRPIAYAALAQKAFADGT